MFVGFWAEELGVDAPEKLHNHDVGEFVLLSAKSIQLVSHIVETDGVITAVGEDVGA